MRTPVYLDHPATTPMDPRVLDAMLPFLEARFGNPASAHAFGFEAAEAVERSRATIAWALGARAEEIVFTSGATESDNLALLGVVGAAGEPGGRVIVGATEHRAVLDSAQRLARSGIDVAILPVDSAGRVDPGDAERALRPGTRIVSLMAANNETGTLHPIGEIGGIARARGIPFHTDAAQALGRIAIDVQAMSLDLVSLTAHKIHGPKGVGALYVRSRPRVALEPMLHGGGQEHGMRSGTLNVAGIVGFAAAVQIALEGLDEDGLRIRRLRERLLERLRVHPGGVSLNGHAAESLPGILNLSFEEVDGEALVTALPDVALSTGSACASARGEPSHVLRAMGLAPRRIQSAVRIGLGRFTSEAEIDFAAGRIAEEVARLRALSGGAA